MRRIGAAAVVGMLAITGVVVGAGPAGASTTARMVVRGTVTAIGGASAAGTCGSAGAVGTVTVTATSNATPPVVTILGTNPLTHECHTPYTDDGATASDTCDGDLTARIVTTNPVDSSTGVGTYNVTYSVTDNSGNNTTVNRVVNVTDTTIPVLTLNGDNPVEHECGTDYSDLGAFAADSCDGDITSLIVTTNPVDANSNTGTYTVRYNVRDVSNNAAVEITRTVNVIDTTRPVITLVGIAFTVPEVPPESESLQTPNRTG